MPSAANRSWSQDEYSGAGEPGDGQATHHAHDRTGRLVLASTRDWLGKVVEAASGVTLDVDLKEGITGPLGMDKTEFIMTGEQRATSTPVHLKGEDGTWAASEIELNQEPEYFAGGHGLHSTPRDYLKFQRALLHVGTFEGIKILEKSTVDAAFTNQIGDLDFPEEIPT
ncbi:MAG: serine hydrolase, partial [Actinomycetota bacterium]|nr:serine hydrolase [Actinomycetota bacterium]